MTELSGFALSQEELLAAIRLAGLPAPLGFDTLEADVLAPFDAAQHPEVLAIAERSMLAHGLLEFDGTAAQLDALVAEWLATICQPAETWVLLHQPAGQRQQGRYVHRGAAGFVMHRGQGGIHQLVQLADTAAIAQTAYELADPQVADDPAHFDALIPEEVFRAIATAHGLDAQHTREQLQQLGFTPELAAAFTQSFVELRSITAFARMVLEPARGIQQAFTLVCGQHAQWVLVPETRSELRLRNVDAPMIQRLLATFVAPLQA